MYIIKTSANNYKIRIRIPDRLKNVFNKCEINKSLKTKSYKDAIIKSKPIIKLYRKIELLSDTGICDLSELSELVKKFNDRFNLSNPSTTVMNNKKIKTHKECLEEFKQYYLDESVVTSKRVSVVNFLEDVFLPVIDSNTPIKLSDFKKLLEVKKTLQELPKRNIQQYRELSVEQLLKMTIPTEDRITNATLHFYFANIKRFYSYYLAQRYIDLNPTDFITIKLESDSQQEREPFTKDEVSQLFNMFDKEDIGVRDILYCFAYSGLRTSELWKSKLKYDKDNSIWYFDLTNKSLKLKTLSSYRIVPLHKHLVDLGIPDRLNESLKRYKQDFIQKRFNNVIKTQITDSDKKVMYSLRHTLATELKYLKVDSLVISEILGHSHEGMTMSRYASKYPLGILKEAIDKLEF